MLSKSRGGAGRNQGRKPDWNEEAKSSISVPYELAEHKQKSALAKTWSILKQSGLDFISLVEILENNGVKTNLVAILESYGIKLLLPEQSNTSHSTQLYPIYSTAVAASFGVISVSDADAGGSEQIDLLARLIEEPERTILLEVIGNSMLDDGILPGSTLIVETTNTTDKSWLEPNDRNTVIALINGVDLTVKKFRRTEKGEFLVPRNRNDQSYRPLQISSPNPEWMGKQEVLIIGIVRKIIQDV